MDGMSVGQVSKQTYAGLTLSIKQATKANTIKLGLDIHADSVSVVRQIDGALPHQSEHVRIAGCPR